MATGGRGAATTAAIENAALDVALEHGYAHTTVALVCERAGVSERTFFNHFPTKQDAILGSSAPRMDERAARSFILSDGPLLIDALSLIDVDEDGGPPARMGQRMMIIASDPALLGAQSERMARINEELAEVIGIRLRHQYPERTDAQIDAEVRLVTELLPGFFRAVSGVDERAHGACEAPVFRENRALMSRALEDVLRDSVIPPVED